MNTQHILVVDDDQVDRKAIRRALTQAGWAGEVHEATDAAGARRALGERPFDCILLDYHLPGVDGLELLAELHGRLEGQVPLVMLTGEGNEMVAVQAMKAGACDYLPKSLLTPAALLRVLQQALERSRLERELREARAQLERQALYDSLTGLGNRSLFLRDLERAVAGARRDGRPFCVLLMDLDRFKAANDRYGHEAGDVILAEVGRRLTAAGRASDAFYRLGGDEFTALLDGLGAAEAQGVAERIRAVVGEPIPWRSERLSVGVSVGLAAWAGASRDELLRAADAAMYEAKRSGRGVASAAA